MSFRIRAWSWLTAALLIAGCRPSEQAGQTPDTFTVMSYNLMRYGLEDRDGDGQRNDPKPAHEQLAVHALILDARPDILVIQEIGDTNIFSALREELRSGGMDYPHADYLHRGRSEANMAVLSRFPIAERLHHTDERYTIGKAEIPVARGFLEATVDVRPDYRLRLLAAHLKSKVFHRLGQTEMRRNEARLLNNRVRAILRENPDENLLVLGDLNDHPLSAALREAIGQELHDVRPADERGDAWTHHARGMDEYARIDYLLVSPGLLPETVTQACRVVRHPLERAASDHQPVLGVFLAEDR